MIAIGLFAWALGSLSEGSSFPLLCGVGVMLGYTLERSRRCLFSLISQGLALDHGTNEIKAPFDYEMEFKARLLLAQ